GRAAPHTHRRPASWRSLGRRRPASWHRSRAYAPSVEAYRAGCERRRRRPRQLAPETGGRRAAGSAGRPEHRMASPNGASEAKRVRTDNRRPASWRSRDRPVALAALTLRAIGGAAPHTHRRPASWRSRDRPVALAALTLRAIAGAAPH